MILQKEFIEQVKKSTDIVKLIGKYVDLEKVGDGVYAGHCPNKDHRDSVPSFRVFEKEQSWCCYGCHYGNKTSSKNNAKDNNYGSDCIAFIQWIYEGKKTWLQSVLYLAKEANLAIPNDPNQSLYDKNKQDALEWHHKLLSNQQAQQYLYSRGLDEEDFKRFLIGYDGIKITFPLIDRLNRVLGFTKRWITLPEGCKDKYRNSKADAIFNKSRYFYGIHLIDQSLKYVYITEGPMDMILATKYGMKNVLCTLGTSFTDEHAEIIFNLGLEPIFIMDGDEAGLAASKKAITKMSLLGVKSKIVPLFEKIDLADIALIYKESLVDYIDKHTMTYSFYVADEFVREYCKELINLKECMRPKFQKAIDLAPDSEKQTLIDMIYEMTNITIGG